MKTYQLTVLIIALCSINLFGQKKENKRPNIIFILADDLGAGDLHCTGHPYAQTPNLDKLSEQGVRFERAYMAGSWCAPSRYGLMSGQFPARNFNLTMNLNPEEPSVTKILKNAGYRTAHFGKWHLNKGFEYADSPGDFGIDTHFTTNHNGNGKTWTKEQRNEEYWRAKTTDAYVDMAIDFIEENNSNKTPQPFYMNLWIYPTHSYIHPTPEELEVYEGLKVDYNDFSNYQQEFLKFVAKHGDIDKAMQAYCADVTAMDKALGRLFAFLKKKGLDKNTLIVFTSDNGPGPLTPQVQSESVVKRYKEKPDLLNSVGSAKIYKERKISLHDGGIRVPFIVSWPKNTPKGKVDKKSLIHGVDWLPTVASICNIDLPDAQFDGIDVKSAFRGEEIPRKDAVYWTQAGSFANLKGKWKSVLSKNDEFQLYDIVSDPSEIKNQKSDYPEVAAEMEKSLRVWMKDMAE